MTTITDIATVQLRALNNFLDSPQLKEHAALTRIGDQLTHLVRGNIEKMRSERLVV